MDAQIRRLVIAGTDKNDVELLTEAFKKLKQNFQVNLVQSKDSIGQDIYVLLAESALDVGAKNIADECLQMFFSSSPVKSQFVGRAYLCQFRMYMPTSALEHDSLNNAVPFLQQCLTFAATSTRYKFLVYNASVIYFNYIRPFLRDNFRKYLCSSFEQLVQTLTNISDETDYLWQAELLFELLRCFLDAKSMDKARETSHRLLDLCCVRKLTLISNVFQFLTVNEIVDNEVLSKFLSPDDPSFVFHRFLIEISTIHRKIRKNQTKENFNEQLKKIFDQIVSTPFRSSPAGTKTTRPDPNGKFLTNYEKHRLLVEAARISLLLRCTDLTKVILDVLGELRFKETEFLLEVRLLQAEYMVKNLGDAEETYQKTSVDTRIRAIELTVETLESLVRTGQDDLVQTGCTILWNLSLPLLQTNLRGKIRKALTCLVNVLERIQSLNWTLRSEAHFELAKIEEDIEQMDSAKANLLKAREFDDGKIYVSRIDLALERLRLRCELYKMPENPDDRVGTIIEQAGKLPQGNKNKQRALLIEACLLLAQDAFQVVLDSENPNAIGKMRANPTAQLKGFSEHYEKCIQNTVHYERLIPETDQNKRLKLWADLTMIARRQEIWDVCRVASRFCLLYDNDQRRSTINQADRNSSSFFFHRDLVRILAEIHFIAAEAEIEFIRERRIELFDTPNRPAMPTVPAAQRAQIQKESDEDWKSYCQWLNQLSTRACQHFATAAVIGQLLNESWLICRAGEYLWNYSRHLFYSNRLRLILEPLSTIFSAMRKIGHEREILLLVNLAVSLSTAHINPLPLSPDEIRAASNVETTAAALAPGTDKKKSNQKTDQTPNPSTLAATTVSSAMIVKSEDLRTALDICEYALHQTNETVAKSRSVSIGDRQTLLQLWVTIKQQMQQPIRSALNSVLGEEEENVASLNTLSRAVIAVDTLSRLETGWQENRETMNLKQTLHFLDQCTWADSLVELQLWSRLGIIGNKAVDIDTTQYAREKSRQLITLFQTRKVEKFQLSLANEYVSRACAAHAECLLKQQTGQKQERKDILAVLVEAASYSAKAELYELTMHIARHYWNTCRPSLKRRLERSLLLDSLNELIHHINAVSPKSIVSNNNDKDGKDDKVLSTESFKPKKQPLNSKRENKGNLEEPQMMNNESETNPQEDAQIRSVLYGVLVQIYMDRHSWHTALDVIDSALQVLPRTQHRLILYKYRVLIKSKLGLSISTDMQKFREQGELALARMWRQVALMAKRRDHVINAYQRCIETLQSFDNYWNKIDYILELAGWLYSNEYLVDNVIDLIEWTIDLLLTSASVYKKRETPSSEFIESISNPLGLSSMLSSSDDHRGLTTRKANVTTESDETNSGSIQSQIPNRLLPDLSISEVVEVRRLEYLFRCHAFLALLNRQNPQEHAIILEKAHWLLTRLWQRGLTDAVDINKDAEAEAAAAAAEALAASNDGSKKAQKGGNVSPTKKKPNPIATGKPGDKQQTAKAAGSFDTSLPKTLADWTNFVLNDDILQIYAFPQVKERGFTKTTIPKPLLSFYYLDLFVGLERDFGYNHFALVALSFMRMISQNLLKSSSMTNYVLIRMQQVCQELNLVQSMQNVCQLARPFTIRDDDLATSRSEMMNYMKLLAQQQEEEAQLESALGSSRLKSEVRSYGTSAYSSTMSRTQIRDAKNLVPDLPGNRQVLNKIICRNTWLQTARLLFELNFIQEAKEILQEILFQSKTFDDQPTEKRAFVLLSQIALHEHRFDQAIDLALQGQQVPIDENEWFISVSTIIEALRQDPKKDHYNEKKIAALLEISIKRLKSIGQLHVNKIVSIAFAASVLSAKETEIEAENLLKEKVSSSIDEKKIFYGLNGVLQKFDSVYRDLISLNKFHEGSDIVLLRAIPIWKIFGRDAKKPAQKKQFLNQALIILEQLMVLLGDRLRSIRSVTSNSDLALIQLPLQRQFVRVQTERISILLDLLQIHAEQMFQQRLRRKTTDSHLLAVEDFVSQTQPPSETDDPEDWEQMEKTLPEKLITSIMATFELVGNVDRQGKAKLLFYLARTFYIIGQNFATEYPLEWNSKIKEILSKLNEIVPEKTGGKRIDSRGGSGFHHSASTLEHESIDEEILAELNRRKAELNSSMFYLCQSVEYALQSLNIALSIQDKCLIQKLSLMLCDSVGQFDPISSIVFLTLSQNASTSTYAEQLLRKACEVPDDCELGSLFRLLDRIKENENRTNSTNGLVYRTAIERLKTYWPYKFLTVRSQFFDLTKDIPASFNFLILHFSVENEILYAALFNSKMSPGRSGAATALGKQANQKASIPSGGSATPQIMKIPLKKTKLLALIDEFEQWKNEYSQALQRYEVKMHHNREKQAILNSEQAEEVDRLEIEQLKTKFIEDIFPQMNDCFSVVSTLLENYLEPEKRFEARTSLSTDHLVLLADPFLAHFPLEYFEVFCHGQIGGISRDFSLQSVFARLAANLTLEEVAPPVEDKAKKGAPKEAAEVTNDLQQVDPNNIYSIVEPILLKSPTPFDLLKQKFAQLVAKWKSFRQENPTLKSQRYFSNFPHEFSTVELERILTEAQGFIFFTGHTIAELIGFYRCPTLSKNGCAMICSFDRTSTSVNSSSTITQTNEMETIKLERSTESALLWSLGGVKSIVLNQWKSTMNENENVFLSTFSEMATSHCSFSQALRLFVYPMFRPVEIDPNNVAQNGKAKGAGAPSVLNKKEKGGRSPSPKSKGRSSTLGEPANKKKNPSIILSDGHSTLTTALTENFRENERTPLQLQQINLIVFGLPNLTFSP